MEDSCGDPKYPIWLIADSEPKRWQALLETPLDPRHPARHNIWTPILDYMQEELYKRGCRFNTARLYIRNAVTDPDDKPNSHSKDWPKELDRKIDDLSDKMQHFAPKIILTFGAFAFEFLRRTNNEKPIYPFIYWGTKRLGEEFRRRISNFYSMKVNVIPLLHVSISRGKFLEGHEYFVGLNWGKPANYFEYVGSSLSRLLLNKLDSDPIWIERKLRHSTHRPERDPKGP